MITTPTVPSAGTSGRPAPVVAPIHQIADEAAQRRAQNQAQTQQAAENASKRVAAAETARAISTTQQTDRLRGYIAEREEAMRDRMSEEALKAAQPQAPVIEPKKDEEAGPDLKPVETIDLLPPPATEVLAKGGRQTRVEARAEMYESEARLRVLQQAAAGYAAGLSALR